MILKINHQTSYKFNLDVFLEPHFIRLYPRRTPYNELQEYKISIFPHPIGLRLQEDEEGNLIHFCWFEKLTTTLTINTEIVLRSRSYNPFDFLFHPGELNKFPFTYMEEQKLLLINFLQPLSVSSNLISYAKRIESESGGDILQFLAILTKTIHSDFVVDYREVGSPLHPDKTFELKSGSCRDLTWMQMNLVRIWGFASRFVSGYYFFESDVEDFELHGWLEVFVPGAGWIGFDPSHGILTGSTHVPLVTGSTVESTMPVSGNYRGEADSQLSTKVSIVKV